jgi:ferrous-iron efflux pump FieF
LHQWTGLDWFDPAFALAIAAGLVVTAFRIAFQALHILMDHELPDEDRAKIKAIVEAQSAVHGLHDMRTRSDSDRIFIELHVEMDAQMSLRDAHAVSDIIVQEVCKIFPNADVIIHQDPAGLEEDRLDAQIARRG